jgi:hypothetical protein
MEKVKNKITTTRVTHKNLLNPYDFVFGNYKLLQEKRIREREIQKFKTK